MPKIYLKVTIEEKWRTQNLDFPSLKSFCTGKFLRCSNSRDIIKFSNFLLQLKNQRSKSKTICGFANIFIREMHHVLQLVQELRTKSKSVMSWSSRKKKDCIFVNGYVVRRNYFQHFCSFLIYSLLNNLSEYIYIDFYISKNIASYTSVALF